MYFNLLFFLCLNTSIFFNFHFLLLTFYFLLVSCVMFLYFCFYLFTCDANRYSAFALLVLRLSSLNFMLYAMSHQLSAISQDAFTFNFLLVSCVMFLYFCFYLFTCDANRYSAFALLVLRLSSLGFYSLFPFLL